MLKKLLGKSFPELGLLQPLSIIEPPEIGERE